ncbi:unnamed protein product [Ectocarpus sp. CCAP 1310/34]|nr:unnamed protein product [Ectocarpus sp. CCAP 1310/34]
MRCQASESSPLRRWTYLDPSLWGNLGRDYVGRDNLHDPEQYDRGTNP